MAGASTWSQDIIQAELPPRVMPSSMVQLQLESALKSVDQADTKGLHEGLGSGTHPVALLESVVLAAARTVQIWVTCALRA